MKILAWMMLLVSTACTSVMRGVPTDGSIDLEGVESLSILRHLDDLGGFTAVTSQAGQLEIRVLRFHSGSWMETRQSYPLSQDEWPRNIEGVHGSMIPVVVANHRSGKARLVLVEAGSLRVVRRCPLPPLGPTEPIYEATAGTHYLWLEQKSAPGVMSRFDVDRGCVTPRELRLSPVDMRPYPLLWGPWHPHRGSLAFASVLTKHQEANGEVYTSGASPSLLFGPEGAPGSLFGVDRQVSVHEARNILAVGSHQNTRIYLGLPYVVAKVEDDWCGMVARWKPSGEWIQFKVMGVMGLGLSLGYHAGRVYALAARLNPGMDFDGEVLDLIPSPYADVVCDVQSGQTHSLDRIEPPFFMLSAGGSLWVWGRVGEVIRCQRIAMQSH